MTLTHNTNYALSTEDLEDPDFRAFDDDRMNQLFNHGIAWLEWEDIEHGKFPDLPPPSIDESCALYHAFAKFYEIILIENDGELPSGYNTPDRTSLQGDALEDAILKLRQEAEDQAAHAQRIAAAQNIHGAPTPAQLEHARSLGQQVKNLHGVDTIIAAIKARRHLTTSAQSWIASR